MNLVFLKVISSPILEEAQAIVRDTSAISRMHAGIPFPLETIRVLWQR